MTSQSILHAGRNQRQLSNTHGAQGADNCCRGNFRAPGAAGAVAAPSGRPGQPSARSEVAELGLGGGGGVDLAQRGAAGDVGRPRVAQEGPVDLGVEGVRLDFLRARVRAQPLGRVTLQQLPDQVLLQRHEKVSKLMLRRTRDAF